MIATCIEDKELLRYVADECKKQNTNHNLRFYTNAYLGNMADN